MSPPDAAVGGAVGVDHQHLAGLQRLERLPLQRVAAAVRVEPVDVLAHRDEPHRERLTDEPVDHLAQRLHPEQLRLPEPPLVQLRRDRRRAHLPQRLQHTLGQRLQLGSGHAVLLVARACARRPSVGRPGRRAPDRRFRSLERRRVSPQRFPLGEQRGTRPSDSPGHRILSFMLRPKIRAGHEAGAARHARKCTSGVRSAPRHTAREMAWRQRTT